MEQLRPILFRTLFWLGVYSCRCWHGFESQQIQRSSDFCRLYRWRYISVGSLFSPKGCLKIYMRTTQVVALWAIGWQFEGSCCVSFFCGLRWLRPVWIWMWRVLLIELVGLPQVVEAVFIQVTFQLLSLGQNLDGFVCGLLFRRTSFSSDFIHGVFLY